MDLSESSGALFFCELRWAYHFLKKKKKLYSKRGRCCYRFAANSQISLMASSRFQIQPDESVLLRVTHSNIKSFSAEIRFSLQVQNPQTLLAESQVSFTETWINLYYFSLQWKLLKISYGENAGLQWIQCNLSFMMMQTQKSLI